MQLLRRHRRKRVECWLILGNLEKRLSESHSYFEALLEIKSLHVHVQGGNFGYERMRHWNAPQRPLECFLANVRHLPVLWVPDLKADCLQYCPPTHSCLSSPSAPSVAVASWSTEALPALVV